MENLSPASTSSKKAILENIDLQNLECRVSWTRSKIYGQHFDALIDKDGKLADYVICKHCKDVKTFNYKGYQNLR